MRGNGTLKPKVRGRVDQMTAQQVAPDAVDENTGRQWIPRVHAETKRIYFTTGHGEPDLDARETPEGLGQLKAALENEGAEVFPLLLATVPDVPADASLLVIAGPQRPFLDNEIEVLERYLDRGGRTWAMIEPQMSEELVPVFADRGITIGDDVIIDQVVQLFAGPTVGLEPVVSDYGFHPITEQFRQNTIFRMVRSVRPADELPAGITVAELARTSANSWAESDLDRLFETQEVDPEGDEAGPISIAVAATLASSALNWTAPAIETAPEGATETVDPIDDEAAGEESEDPAETEADTEETTEPDEATPASDATAPFDLEGRVVVVGDAQWVQNTRLTVMYNEDLALNVVAWLTGGDDETISIRPRARRASTITLTGQQGWGVFYATVLLLPELVLLSGLMIWWRRRR